jgi:uncharacterized protein YceK
MRTVRHIIGALAMLFSITGCMSISARRGELAPPCPRYVYPGPQVDCRILTYSFDEQVKTDALYAGMAYMYFPVALLDFPFSLIFDTICLPYDVFKVTIGGRTRYGERENCQQIGAP